MKTQRIVFERRNCPSRASPGNRRRRHSAAVAKAWPGAELGEQRHQYRHDKNTFNGCQRPSISRAVDAIEINRCADTGKIVTITRDNHILYRAAAVARAPACALDLWRCESP